MGTVGLSFGSPTSGTGFDVSATVAEIVSNLQNVETPWQTQLSSLESQDAVISNLGTLFSNVSNDMSSLTDLQGILAEKTGSSSNTNVLELTSASSSATAGTHTVTVNALAATSSGYLTQIANASDTLSGSITLAVGSGAAQAITLDSSDDTLSGLASAINSSGLGITANVLTDASGSQLSLVSGTSGAGGNISVTANSITDTTTSTALSYTTAVTGSNASLTVDGVNLSSASNTVTNLIPGVTFQLLATSSTPVQVIIGNDNTDVESTVNQFVTDYNSLVSAMNTQEGDTSSGTPEPLFGSPTLTLLQEQLLSGINTQNPNGYLTSIPTGLNATLSGSISIQVGASGTPQVIDVPAGPGNTLSGLASAINAANIGVTAAVITSNGQSSLTLTSQTDGSSGALTVTSALTTNPLTLSYTDAGYTDTTADSGTVGEVASGTDTLSGYVTIQVGSGAAQQVNVGDSSTPDTIYGLADAINDASIGVTASVVPNSDGTLSLSLESNTDGAAGALTVGASNLTDTTTTALDYTPSSDISSLTSLGISMNNDGSLTFDASTLDSVLNSDYSGVAGFFQNVDSWGMTFANMLNNAGTGSPTDILALAQSSNSSTESTLNAEISNENSLISAESSSLTTELNSANEIMQELPSQLNGINELYSAVTGYDQNLNG